MVRYARSAALLALVAACSACNQNEDGTVPPASGWQPATLVGSGTTCYDLVSSQHVPVLRDPAPRIAVNAAGQALLVWSRCDGTDNTAWAARFTGGTWQTAAAIGTGGNDFLPQVVLGPGGAGLALWTTRSVAGADTFAATFDAARGWSAPEAFVEGGGFPDALFADAQGTPIAVWADGRVGSITLGASRRLASGWTEPQAVSVQDTPSGAIPLFGADARGDVLAVWEGSAFRDWFSRLDVTGGWSAPATVDAAGALAVAPGGNAIKAATTTAGGVRVERFTGGQWSSPELVADGSVGSAALTLDDAGRSTAVWLSAALPGVWGSHHEAGGGWTEAVRLAPDESRQLRPLVTADGSANATAVWQGQNADGTIGWIQAARHANGRWGTPEHIQDGPIGSLGNTTLNDYAAPTDLAADGAGNVIAVWYEVRGNRVDIWARRFVAR